jgi:hypothetical protein
MDSKRFIAAARTLTLCSILSSGSTAAFVFATVAGAFCMPASLHAQSFTAAITGTVTDQSGAAVPNARVEIRNTGTNEIRTVTSDGSGLFTADQLLPGQYQLSVSAPSFKSFVERGITLDGSQRAEHNARLQLGSVDQTVEVSAAQVALDTQTANREVTLDSQQMENFPTSFRNPMYVVQNTAGVVSVRTGLSASPQDQNQNRFALNGGRDESSAVLVDGASIVAPDLGGAIVAPTMDAVQETQVQRTAYDPQFTHTDGGVVSMITKSGSNAFHGTAFEYLRNNHLDANGWTNNHNKIARPLFQRNQFGGSLGGRVWRDKAFFFGAYEGFRQAQPNTYTYLVPTALERAGNFSQSKTTAGAPLTIYNPFNPTSGQRQQFAGNVIPSSLINPVGQAAVNLYPLPNSTVSTAYNFAKSVKSVDNFDKIDIRGDLVFNAKDSAFGRITKAWQRVSIPRVFNNPADSSGGENDYRQEIILNNTWTPNAKWVVNTVVSYGKWTENDTSASYGHSATDLGFSSATVGQWQASNAYPQFNVDRFATLGYSQYGISPHETDNLQLNATRELNRNSLKFGFLGEIERLYQNYTYSPTFSFTSGMTAGPTPVATSTTSGSAIASLLLGTGASGSVPIEPKLDLQQLNFGWYIQDTWRATQRLTITAGIRHDIQNARTERFNRINNFDPTAAYSVGANNVKGGLVFATPSNRGLWQAQHDNFDPRLSLAYKITDKLVWRMGYGIFNPNVYAYSGDALLSSDGYLATTTWQASLGGDGVTPNNLVSNPFPNGLVQPAGNTQGLQTLVGQSIHAAQRRHPTPYLQVYSGDFQYQISNSGVLELGYAGTQGRQLLYGVFSDLNQLPSQYLSLGTAALNKQVPNRFAGSIGTGTLAGATVPYWRTLVAYPQFTNVIQLADTPGSSSSFNALSVKYNQRLRYGFNLLMTYQWSKAIDDTSENNGWELSDALRDTYNHKLDRSISGHDIPQNFVGTIGWDLPFGHGREFASNANRWVDGVIGGWHLDTILRFNDGLPIHLSETSSLNSYNYEVARPNITSQANLKPANRTTLAWFNTSAVSYASAGTSLTIGDAPRWISSVRYDVTHDTDMAMQKVFPLYRESKFIFRAEAYNITNTPEFASPDTNLGDSGFGQVTGTGSVGPRQLQFGARVEF